ncbi:MAG: hypothetical protein OXU96_10205 [Gammaproteobacteria bacterium]|nr:hypothetical protein [Gammaproteobacteria bacterium]
MGDFSEFQFDPRTLAGPRRPGISAYMRIKNEQQLVRIAVMSHIDHYDEIIACYNGCTDDTERILHDLAAQYPRKLKVMHYQPKVHPPNSREHAQTADNSVHSLANYYNWALSKTTRQVAVKLDADHLAIAGKLSALTAAIRRDLAAGRGKLYLSSGINLLRDPRRSAVPGVRVNYLLAGQTDFVYHPVNEQTVYRNDPQYESFDIYRLPLEVEYTGITFFHLRALKLSHHYRPPPSRERLAWLRKEPPDLNATVPYEQFCSARYQRQLRRRLPAQLGPRSRLMFHLSASATLRRLKRRLTGEPAGLLREQLARLEDDLRDIDFSRDVLDPLRRWEGEAGANAPCIAGSAWAESPAKHDPASSARGQAPREL